MQPPTTSEQATARARLEFRANESGFARVGLTENEFVTAELTRQGFSTKPADPSRIMAPLYERLPGLVSMAPGPHEVGALPQ